MIVRQGGEDEAILESLRGSRIVLVGVILAAWSFGCARLEPMIEPETDEHQVTVDSLKTPCATRSGRFQTCGLSWKTAGRNWLMCRWGRAQLQGMLREAESRLLDARHIIDLQREELASARVEREHVAQSGRRLHSRMRQLEKLLSQGRNK